MNILFIITGLGMGGAECQVCDLADQLSMKGNKVFIICLTGDVIKKPISNDIEIIHLGLNKKPLSFLIAYIKAALVIKKIKPDIVHSHLYHANIFARILRFFCFYPVLICSAHNKNDGGKLRMLTYRITDALATISTNVSQEAVDFYIECKASRKNKMLVFYNGIDLGGFKFNSEHRRSKRAELSIEENVTLFLSVGRLTKQKDYPNLLNAFANVKNKNPSALVIIGVGELEFELKELSKELNISDRVYWLGLRNDVNQWMSACDIFVLSSQSEGFGLVVAEAMACQRVVIATDCGGVKEVLGNTGKLIPPSNSILLAETMQQVINMPMSQVNSIGTNARKRVNELYSLENVTKKWLDLYNLLKK